MIKDIFKRLSAAVGRIFSPAPPVKPGKPPELPVISTSPSPSPITGQSVPPPEPVKVAPVPVEVSRKAPPRRPPKMWNIGLDFGTAFTKCIVRDLGSDDAFIVPLSGDQFLLPSEVWVGNNSLGLAGEPVDDGSLFRVQNLKMTLAELADGKKSGVWAAGFLRLSERYPHAPLAANPADLTAYFLARTIQKAKSFILQKSPDFDEANGDRCFLNMAVPVAHAENTAIANKFDACLRQAWLLACETNLPNWNQQQFGVALKNLDGRLSTGEMPCYLYPEVSANVQSYIKSRAGTDGLYLFVDVGAGTVDLSIFIYYTHPSNDRPITYVEAGVLPLGSSQIEIRAAHRIIQNPQSAIAYCDGVSVADKELLQFKLHEMIRSIKEGGKRDEPLYQAMKAAETVIEADLFEQSAKVLGGAKLKLVRDANGHNRPAGAHQWRTLNLLIGGGGAQTALYSNAINAWFEQCCNFTPDRKPIPMPQDLKWPANLPTVRYAGEFSRFTVAYGLSFHRANLEDHRFPKEVRPLASIYEEPRNRPHAPSKDEC